MGRTQTSGRSVKGGYLPASPHGPIEELFDGVWFVRAGVRMPMFLPMRIGRAMTIVRADDGLALFNSVRLSDAGLNELDALGEVKHVIRLAGFHGRDDGFYRERYDAKVYAIEGQRYERGLDPKKADPTPYMEPDHWLNESSPLPIADASLKVFATANLPEAICRLGREGGILIAGDSLQHTPEPDEYHNFLAKIVMKRMGFMKPYNVGPAWLKLTRPTAADVRSVLDLDFEHVLPTHGAPVIGGAREKYRPTIEGELEGARA